MTVLPKYHCEFFKSKSILSSILVLFRSSKEHAATAPATKGEMLQVVFVAKLGVFYSQPEEEMLNTAVVPVESLNNQLTSPLHLLLCQDPDDCRTIDSF